MSGKNKKFKIIYITFPSRKDAEKIGRTLLENKLIACCNIFPVKSLYLWNKRIVRDNEHVLIAKTLESKVKDLISFVKKNHPYKIPFIGIFDINVNEEYYNWANNILK